MEKVKVVPYNKIWKTEFVKAYNFYNELLKGLDITIEHVGSTSIDGCAAKPIIDLVIILKSYGYFNKVVKLLGEIGYVHVGDRGISGR